MHFPVSLLFKVCLCCGHWCIPTLTCLSVSPPPSFLPFLTSSPFPSVPPLSTSFCSTTQPTPNNFGFVPGSLHFLTFPFSSFPHSFSLGCSPLPLASCLPLLPFSFTLRQQLYITSISSSHPYTLRPHLPSSPSILSITLSHSPPSPVRRSGYACLIPSASQAECPCCAMGNLSRLYHSSPRPIGTFNGTTILLTSYHSWQYGLHDSQRGYVLYARGVSYGPAGPTTNQFYTLDLTQPTWTTMNPPWRARVYPESLNLIARINKHSISVSPDKQNITFWVAYPGMVLNYTIATDTWTQVPKPSQLTSSGDLHAETDPRTGLVYYPGGYNNVSMGVYNPATQSFTPATSPNGFVNDRFYASVWSELRNTLIFYGNTPIRATNPFVEYSTSSNKWTALVCPSLCVTSICVDLCSFSTASRRFL